MVDSAVATVSIVCSSRRRSAASSQPEAARAGAPSRARTAATAPRRSPRSRAPSATARAVEAAVCFAKHVEQQGGMRGRFVRGEGGEEGEEEEDGEEEEEVMLLEAAGGGA